jgi:hypothetical protein
MTDLDELNEALGAEHDEICEHLTERPELYLPHSSQEGKQQMEGCKVLDGTCPERALIEIRNGKFWDGAPAISQKDGSTSKDGFYFVELTPEDYILNDILHGPYANVEDAELAARESYVPSEINRALTELERIGAIRRVVRKEN